jgi:hypothetical protein
MAFPWLVESNFEQGSNAEWTSESDTGSLLDFPHYSVLSNQVTAPVPYRGAYCLRILPGDTNDHTVTSTSITIADESTAFFRWYMWISTDFTATADDTLNIFELQQAGGTIEQSVSLRITAATNLLEIGVGDGVVATSFVSFPRGRWVVVELQALQSTTAGGLMTLFLDEVSAVALTTLTGAAAIGKGVLGTQDTLSTTGVGGGIYIDQFIMDDARIYGLPIRYPESLLMTKTGHAFVGTGQVLNASLLSGAAQDNVLQIFDTDQNNTLHSGRMKLELKNVVNSDIVDPAGVPIDVQRGCYVVLTGTNPRAMISIGNAQGYYSQGRIKQHGVQWRNTPGGW